MNVKRRVYDALNVLIAVGLLYRNGNRITVKRKQLLNGEDSGVEMAVKKETLEKERNSLKEECLERSERIRRKTEQLKLLHSQMDAYRKVTNRNRAKPTGSHVRMPFIVLCKRENAVGGELVVERQKEEVVVRCQGGKIGLMT